MAYRTTAAGRPQPMGMQPRGTAAHRGHGPWREGGSMQPGGGGTGAWAAPSTLRPGHGHSYRSGSGPSAHGAQPVPRCLQRWVRTSDTRRRGVGDRLVPTNLPDSSCSGCAFVGAGEGTPQRRSCTPPQPPTLPSTVAQPRPLRALCMGTCLWRLWWGPRVDVADTGGHGRDAGPAPTTHPQGRGKECVECACKGQVRSPWPTVTTSAGPQGIGMHGL